MKIILFASLICFCISSPVQEEYLNFFAGFTRELSFDFNASLLQYANCLRNQTYPLSEQLREGVVMLTSFNLTEIEIGYQLIANASVQILDSTVNCSKSTESDVRAIIRLFLSQIGHSMYRTINSSHVTINGVNVTEEKAAMIQYVQDGFRLGRSVARMLNKFKAAEHKFLWELEQADKVAPLIKLGFVHGFLKASGFKTTPYYDCEFGNLDDLHYFQMARNAIAHGQIMHGFHDFLHGLREFKRKGLATCGKAIAETESIALLFHRTVIHFSSPTQFTYWVGVDIKLNQEAIQHELNQIVKEWDDAHYYEVGDNLGKLVYQVFVGQPI